MVEQSRIRRTYSDIVRNSHAPQFRDILSDCTLNVIM